MEHHGECETISLQLNAGDARQLQRIRDANKSELAAIHRMGFELLEVEDNNLLHIRFSLQYEQSRLSIELMLRAEGADATVSWAIVEFCNVMAGEAGNLILTFRPLEGTVEWGGVRSDKSFCRPSGLSISVADLYQRIFQDICRLLTPVGR